MLNIKLLNHLIRVMTDVADKQLPLNMELYYQICPADEDRGVEACGTAACVAGYGAMDEKVLNHIQINDDTDAQERASALYDWLVADVGPSVAHSICLGRSPRRYTEACVAGLPETLTEMTHIQSESPSPQDAVDYMEALRDHLRATGKVEVE